jgi:hypothetical protein
MKESFELTENKFTPVTLSLTFESQAELDAFGQLSNYVLFTSKLRKFNCPFPSYNILRQMGANINTTDDVEKAFAVSTR